MNEMAKRKRRSKKNKSSSFKPIAVWGGVLIAAGLFAYVFFAFEQKPLDQITMCPSEGPIGVTALVLDLSDELTPAQEAKLERLLKSTDLPIIKKGERLDVYLLPEDKEKPETLISMCNPGSMSDATNVDKFNKASRMFRIEWNKFLRNKDRVLTKLENDAQANTSPISETINFVTSTSFPNADITLEQPANYKLIVVSDMLQNSKNLSVFNEKLSIESEFGHALFYGGETYIYQLVSDKYKRLQTTNLVLFWERQISKAGSRLMRWEKW